MTYFLQTYLILNILLYKTGFPKIGQMNSEIHRNLGVMRS